jgi:DNA recombination protein RmuC
MTELSLLITWAVGLFAGGAILGTLITWLISRGTHQALETKVELLDRRSAELVGINDNQAKQLSDLFAEKGGLQSQLARLEEMNRSYTETLQSLERLRTANTDLQSNMARLEESQRSDQEKLLWVEHARKELADTFDALASRTIMDTGKTLLDRHMEQMTTISNAVGVRIGTQEIALGNLIKPLGETLAGLDKHVKELEVKREGAYSQLNTQLVQLATHQSEFQLTTTRLQQALKSSTVRGHWGEVQLKRVVELAGMKNYIDFQEQVTSGNARPDMIVNMPNHGILPIDAKSPMSSYLEAMESTDEKVRVAKLREHSNALASRVNELSNKKYWDQFADSKQAPEFVVMFVPNEACLSAAFEYSATLFEDAMTKKVLIVSPVTLLALLKAVAYGWQQKELSTNNQKIVDTAKILQARMYKFLEYYAKLGKGLENSVKSFNEAVGSYESRIKPSLDTLISLGLY